MTPQERQLLSELFDRLATLESAPRDPDAVAAINEGLRRAPNAIYPLVQTTLVQDEALKRADARIRELEDELGIERQPPRQGGFLDSMRGVLLGDHPAQGSAPSVRSGAAEHRSRVWGPAAAQSAGNAPAPEQAPAGGSFLGTAAASAAGVIGGALLMNSLRGLFGSHGTGLGRGLGQGRGFDPSGSAPGTPWGSPGSSGGDLARQAGLDDMDRGDGALRGDPSSQRAGLFDTAQDEGDDDSDFEVDYEDDDFGDDTDTT